MLHSNYYFHNRMIKQYNKNCFNKDARYDCLPEHTTVKQSTCILCTCVSKSLFCAQTKCMQRLNETNVSWSYYERRHQTYLSFPLRCSRVMVKMACEREEAAFIAVEPTVRAEFPSSRHPTISWAENTCLSVKPTIWKTETQDYI